VLGCGLNSGKFGDPGGSTIPFSLQPFSGVNRTKRRKFELENCTKFPDWILTLGFWEGEMISESAAEIDDVQQNPTVMSLQHIKDTESVESMQIDLKARWTIDFPRLPLDVLPCR